MSEQQCNTVNEQKCETKYDTVNEQQCSTVNEQQCNTVQEQQCNTVNEQVISPLYSPLPSFFYGFSLICSFYIGLQHSPRTAMPHSSGHRQWAGSKNASFPYFLKKGNSIVKTMSETVLAKVCNTVNEQQCSTVNEEQCSTVNEQVDSTGFSFVGR